jgi:hypothetical protein
MKKGLKPGEGGVPMKTKMYQVTVYTPSAARQTFTFTRKRNAERCALYSWKKGCIVETDEGIMRRIAQLVEDAALRATRNKNKKKLSFKVSDKGGVSVYGLGRFPVTLYKEQWERILAEAEKIQEFIRVNEHLLKTKSKAS